MPLVIGIPTTKVMNLTVALRETCVEVPRRVDGVPNEGSAASEFMPPDLCLQVGSAPSYGSIPWSWTFEGSAKGGKVYFLGR